MIRLNKSGMYYILDAILAGMLLTGVVVLLISNQTHSEYESPDFLSQDLLDVLSTLKVSELDVSALNATITNKESLDFDNNVIEQIGMFWALNFTDDATSLINLTLSSINISKNIVLNIGGDELYVSGISKSDKVSLSRRMVAGIDKGKPITGTSASAYLKKVRDKKTSSYSYFGGFIGQGNISKTLYLPSDFLPSRLLGAELKAEIPGNFQILINGDTCGSLNTGVESDVSVYDLSLCNSSFIPETNLVELVFSSEINESYVSGGYIKASYTTDVLNEGDSNGSVIYNFPGIDGLINIYDSISAQGVITGWKLNISFYNEYDTFMTLGNETVFYAPGQNESRNLIIQNNDPNLPPSQIPLRVGVTNLSNVSTVLDGLPADTFLITDVSGSMGTCGVYEEENVTYCSYEYYSCMWWWCNWYYTECPYENTCSGNPCGGTTNTRNHASFVNTEQVCTATFMDVAKDADKIFVNEVLGESLEHKIGLVSFSTNANLDHSLSNVNESLQSEIDTYSANGGTCTCCGLNRARDAILSSDRERFLVLLSDGEPTYYCDDLHDYTGSGTGGSVDQVDKDAAFDAAAEACSNNITVYSIGFGDGISSSGHDVLESLACNESLYYSTTDMDELANIFRNISSQILLQANFSSQTIEVEGDFINSVLNDSSYLEIFYDSFEDQSDVGKIELSFESDPFGCNASVYIPANLEITDAKVASFSGNDWTRKLNISNSLVSTLIYDLDLFGSDYPILGDPFQIQVPAVILEPGEYNDLSIIVGDSPTNTSSCMPHNTLIYSGFLNSSTPRTDSLEFADGCSWFVETSSGSILNLNIPEFYSGTNSCYYNSSGAVYNEFDAYDVAMASLVAQLDPDGMGKIIVDLDESDLEIQLTIVDSIPYMWGPSIVKLEVRP